MSVPDAFSRDHDVSHVVVEFFVFVWLNLNYLSICLLNIQCKKHIYTSIETRVLHNARKIRSS